MRLIDADMLEPDTEWDDLTDGYVSYSKLQIDTEPAIEVSEDNIDRKALLDSFRLSEKTRKHGGDHSGYDTLMSNEIQDIIEDAPSIVPSGPTGKWEVIKDQPTLMVCNNCGFVLNRFVEADNFCPCCGSRNEKVIEAGRSEESE